MASPVFVSAVTTSSGSETAAGGQGRQRVASAAVTDERKRKRKESNRLSARRSRARKQLQVDELTAQAAELRGRNGAIAAAAHEAMRRCAAVEAENQLLRARTLELSARLLSIVDLIYCMDTAGAGATPFAEVDVLNGVLPPQPSSAPLLGSSMHGNYYNYQY